MAALIPVGDLDTPGNAVDVERVGNLAYVADERRGLRTIDVSNPASPVEIGAIAMPDAAWGVEVAHGLAYVADFAQGLRVVDVSDPTSPVELGALDTPGSAYNLAWSNGLVYVGADLFGLRILDFGPEYAGSIEVALDIKPGSDPNAINLADEGVIAVAIVGSADFDVAQVDAATLAFGPGAAAPDHSHGPHFEDVNADGFNDLVAHFRTEETGIEFG